MAATSPAVPRVRYSITLFFLAMVICIASLQQLPQLDRSAFIKPLISVAEFFVLGLMYRMAPADSGRGKLLAFAAIFVLLRFAYGWGISSLQYSTTLADALQEGRFGIMIMIAPVAYLCLKNLTVAQLERLLFLFTAFIILIDVMIFLLYVRTGILILAGRGAERFVLALISPLAILWIKIVITHRFGMPQKLTDLIYIGIFFLHLLLLTTSRTEAVLTCGILAQWIYIRTPNLRMPLIAFMGAVIFLGVSSVLEQGQRIAGRDFSLAMIYTRDAFPFGMGIVSDTIQKAQLGRVSDFFASDYGLLVLVYRYGALGVLMVAGVLGFWAAFALRTMAIAGNLFVAIALLFYLAIIPILDYGSMNGGIMLGAMAAVMASSYRRVAAQPEQRRAALRLAGV